MYSEGAITSIELDALVGGEMTFRKEFGPGRRTELPTRDASPKVGQKKKRQDTDLRSSTLSSISADFVRDHKQSLRSSRRQQNERDPISLAPLREAPAVFECRVGGGVEGAGSGSVVRYDAPGLAAYLVASGDFIEPTTRQALSDEQLLTLDALAVPFGAPSAFAAKRDRQAHYAAAKEQRDLVEGLERCLGEVVVEMVDQVDQTVGSPADEADPLPLVERFHDFDHYLGQLASADPVLCRTCLQQYYELARGPKNKRRPSSDDASGLLPVLLNFLNEKILAVTRDIHRAAEDQRA